VGPLANDLGVSDCARSAAEHAERAAADLVAVAVRAVQDIAGPPARRAQNPLRPLGTSAVTVPSTISPP
jgi:hypothetical protein